MDTPIDRLAPRFHDETSSGLHIAALQETSHALRHCGLRRTRARPRLRDSPHRLRLDAGVSAGARADQARHAHGALGPVRAFWPAPGRWRPHGGRGSERPRWPRGCRQAAHGADRRARHALRRQRRRRGRDRTRPRCGRQVHHRSRHRNRDGPGARDHAACQGHPDVGREHSARRAHQGKHLGARQPAPPLHGAVGLRCARSADHQGVPALLRQSEAARRHHQQRFQWRLHRQEGERGHHGRGRDAGVAERALRAGHDGLLALPHQDPPGQARSPEHLVAAHRRDQHPAAGAPAGHRQAAISCTAPSRKT